jgi:hypothetical protein
MRRARDRLVALAVTTGAVVISGCVSQTNTLLPLTECAHPSGWCKEIRQTAAEAYLYAQLSANAYGTEDFKLPANIVLIRPSENDSIDFAASVYERRDGDQTSEIVVAFRGTEGFLDWLFGNLLGLQNDRGVELVKSIKNARPGIPITVTGHSLGGGIATQVSLDVENVNSYVFNTSPRFLSGNHAQNNRHSIVEYGEVNKLLRLLGREATQIYTPINCTGGNPIRQHKQTRLAACLTKIAAYDLESARQSAIDNGIPLNNDMQ